ncbi:MAG: hypothetical protein ACE5K8_00550 [Candidatus Zixiibacteriota bacterium]
MRKEVGIWTIGVVVVIGAIWYLTSAKHAVSQTNRSWQSKQTAQQEVSLSERSPHNDSLSTDTSKAPKAFFPETSYDFGVIAQGSKVSHTFVVRNIGDAPLKLINAKAG